MGGLQCGLSDSMGRVPFEDTHAIIKEIHAQRENCFVLPQVREIMFRAACCQRRRAVNEMLNGRGGVGFSGGMWVT